MVLCVFSLMSLACQFVVDACTIPSGGLGWVRRITYWSSQSTIKFSEGAFSPETGIPEMPKLHPTAVPSTGSLSNALLAHLQRLPPEQRVYLIDWALVSGIFVI